MWSFLFETQKQKKTLGSALSSEIYDVFCQLWTSSISIFRGNGNNLILEDTQHRIYSEKSRIQLILNHKLAKNRIIFITLCFYCDSLIHLKQNQTPVECEGFFYAFSLLLAQFYQNHFTAECEKNSKEAIDLFLNTYVKMIKVKGATTAREYAFLFLQELLRQNPSHPVFAKVYETLRDGRDCDIFASLSALYDSKCNGDLIQALPEAYRSSLETTLLKLPAMQQTGANLYFSIQSLFKHPEDLPFHTKSDSLVPK